MERKVEENNYHVEKFRPEIEAKLPLFGAVLKINAYSYGLLPAAQILTGAGVDYLFVQEPEFALYLRTQEKVSIPIVILYRSVVSQTLLCKL